MKKITAFIISAMILLHCVPVMAAHMASRSEIRAFIDYTPIDSYIIDGYTYIAVDELVNYGFEVVYDEAARSLNVSRIKFATPIYTREMWEKSTARQTSAEIGNSDISVYLDGERTESYFADGKLLIMIDALHKYGTFEWDASSKKVSITMFQDELQRELDNAEGVAEIVMKDDGYFKTIYKGQVDENNAPNGIGRLEVKRELNTETYLGYFKDGNPDGYVYKNTFKTVTKAYVHRYINFIGKIDGTKKSKREYIWNEKSGVVTLKREENFGVSILPIEQIPGWTGPERPSDVDVYTEGCYYECWYGKTGDHEYRIWHDGADLQTISDMSFASWGGDEDADFQAYINDNFASLSEFYEYVGGVKTFYDGAIRTVSGTDEIVLNDPEAGAKQWFEVGVDLNEKAVTGAGSYNSAKPVMKNDRVLVPIRFIAEELGAEVEWEDATRTAIIVRDGKTITIQIDSQEMQVGDEKVTLDVPAQIISSRTYVPVRAISEAFDAQVEWNADLKMVEITTQ